jgi:hypothetical protein
MRNVRGTPAATQKPHVRQHCCVIPRGLLHSPHQRIVRLTLAISCEAVPPSVSPAGAQGGTSVRRTGAALSFVSCIDGMDSSHDLVGI